MPDPQQRHNHLSFLLESLNALLADSSSDRAYAERSRDAKPISFYDALKLDLGVARPAAGVSPASDTLTDVPSLRREIVSLMEQARLCCQAPVTPIVSVLGLLNAGKSSLVASFLSQENRRRVLVGSANSEGTHRFVLWVPEEWQTQPDVWTFIQQRLRHLFGWEPEMLSADPNQAAAQYNDTSVRQLTQPDGSIKSCSTIEIPLLGTDSNLNRWGLAIMDCPDVQTGLLSDAIDSVARYPSVPTQGMGSSIQSYSEHAASIANARLQVLARASHLCSTFVLVLPANALHDETVSRLMRVLDHQMPNIQQILAVNRVPRKYSVATIREELEKLYGHTSVRRKYMAYSYEGPLDRQRIPKPPADYVEPAGQPLPLFFRIDGQPPPQPPQAIPESDWLLHIGSQLDKVSLVDDVLSTTLIQLRGRIQEGMMGCETRMRQSHSALLSLKQTIANACFRLLARNAGWPTRASLRLLASKQIVQQISSSLERTAPWWARPGRWTSRIAEASKAGIAKSTRWFPLPSWFTGPTESIGRWIQARWTSGKSGQIVTAETLADFLRRHDGAGHLQLDGEMMSDSENATQIALVRSACQRAIERFQSESRIALDDRELDSLTSKMWSEMPWTKRVAAGFAPAGDPLRASHRGTYGSARFRRVCSTRFCVAERVAFRWSSRCRAHSGKCGCHAKNRRIGSGLATVRGPLRGTLR